jgi:dolichol-phosphate mannosyltransferase
MIDQRIIVIGASGFVGSGVFSELCNNNYEVYGIGRKNNPWRIEHQNLEKYYSIENQGIFSILNELKPKIILNFAASGAYSFQNNFKNMVDTNLTFLENIAHWSLQNQAFLIHAGTSSEYGLNSAGPKENSITIPNSLYSITKLAATHLLNHYSSLGLNSITLRLYSVYGPREDASRLIPAVMRGILLGNWPNFANPKISRDFIYIDDVSSLIIKIIKQQFIKPNKTFDIYNVGTGRKTTIGDLVQILMSEFEMPQPATEQFPRRDWDVEDWYANIEKVTNLFDWKPKYDLKVGLNKMKEWYLKGDNVEYLSDEYSEK